MKTIKWDEDKFRRAVESSRTISDVLRQIGLSTHGGNFKTFHLYVDILDIDISHFTGKAHGKTHYTGGAKKNSEVLIESSTYRGDLYPRLVSIGREEICSKCKCGNEWNGEPLRLHVDHINGVNNDHRPENLRFLCPNCHSQTPTYSGRNNSNNIKKYCADCGVKIHKGSTRCAACATIHTGKKHISWPALGNLTEMVNKSGYESVGRTLGVSGNAVKKHIISREKQIARRTLCPQSICSDTPVL